MAERYLKPKQAPIFAHPVLEKLAQSSLRSILLLDTVLVFFFIWAGFYWGNLHPIQLFGILIGLVMWTLMEYLLHRFAFHYEPKSEQVKKRLYPLHAFHHDYPADKDHLFMPPLANVMITFTLFGLSYLVMGPLAWFFTTGLILGYMVYSTMHYAIHTIKPPFPFLKVLWRNHQLHHHRFPDRAFGVSSPFWDIVLGTKPQKSATDRPTK
jgi:4-hydroxysphinganine ceramide fatty acyl 2-hydroxylase